MKNLFVLPVAVCLLAFVVSDVNAQFGNYGNYGNRGNFGPGHGSNYYGGNRTDPRLGYCLNNDCSGGGGGCGGGSTRVIIRITTGGQGAPTVQSYYPQIQNGCNGYYGNQPRNSGAPVATRRPLSNRYRAPQSGASNAVSRIPATAANTGRASYRYKF